jgi:hypothetical protein
MSVGDKINRTLFTQLYEDGLSDQQLADIFEISTWTVQKIRIQFGLLRVVFKRLDYDEMRRLYDLGWNDVAIAKALDTYSVTVGNWRKRNNLQVNNEVHRKMLRTRDFNRAILEDVDAARAGKIRDPESLYFDTKFLEKFMGRKIAEA